MTPAGLDLLDEAAALLRDDLGARLSGEDRYLALLAANAVATARREAALAGRLAASAAGLAGAAPAIRAGRHDDDAALHARLLADATLRAWVSDPRSVGADEAKRIEEDAR